jgi:hypothetical protein
LKNSLRERIPCTIVKRLRSQQPLIWAHHAFGEIGIRRLHQQMVVVTDQAVGATHSVEVLDHRAENVQEGAAICAVDLPLP